MEHSKSKVDMVLNQPSLRHMSKEHLSPLANQYHNDRLTASVLSQSIGEGSSQCKDVHSDDSESNYDTE